MAGSLNRATLIGNVGKDPEIRSLNNGGKVANFSVATSESWKDKHSGEKKEKTEWHNVVVFNDGLVGVVQQYVKKGSRVMVEGEIQTRKWQDKDGNDRYSTEIVLQGFGGRLLLLSGGGGERREDNYAAQSGGRSAAPDIDDSIPF